MSKQVIERIMAEYPELCAFGFRNPSDSTFEADRQEMISANGIAQFERARDFLRRQRKTANFNMHAGTSYGLKHVAERTLRREGRYEDCYISNGMFIAAAIAEGFKFHRGYGLGPNVWLNIQKIAIRRPGNYRSQLQSLAGNQANTANAP